MSKTTKYILVIRLSAMGDVAMSVPVLRAFTKQYPEVKLTVLTKAFFKPFFRDLPNVSVFEADTNGKHKGVLGLHKLSKELKKLDIDAIADLHNVLRTKIVKVFFFGKKCVQINKGRAEKKALVNGRKFEQLKTTHQRYADVFEALGYKVDLSNPTFPNKAKLSNSLINLVGEKSLKWIGIAPFATYESKMYPLDLMEQVITSLSKKHKIFLFGAKNEEAETLESLSSKYNNVISLAGKLGLNDELDVISNLDVMLSMDSGNAHIAAMLGVKVITIWGVTHPFVGFYPFNQLEEFALKANRKEFPLIPTSVYGNKFPDTYKDAARSILPEKVIEKVNSVIQNEERVKNLN